MTFYREHLTYCFRISTPFVKLLETHEEIDEKRLKEIDEKRLKNDANKYK